MTGPRLSIIPAGAVTDRTLEPRDLQVLCLLGRHLDKMGWCVRSQVRMAAELDCGRSSVQRSLDRLYEAGWVERKQRGTVIGEEAGQPSMSHAYRVRLDRDDFAFEQATREAPESHAETASQDDDNPPVGSHSEPQNGHPGAQPSTGTGAQPYVGTNNDPSQRSSIERERDARARAREAEGLVDFEARWPSAAADDRQRTAYAWAELTDEEREQALGSIAKFLENLKRLGRKGVPAGWKYLEEKRWTLLEAEKPASTASQKFAADSVEAKAIEILHAIIGKTEFLNSIMRSREDRGIYYRGEISPRLLAVASAPPASEWASLNRQQAGAWNGFLTASIAVQSWNRLTEGSRAPWPWPPSAEGKIYTTGPPEAEVA